MTAMAVLGALCILVSPFQPWTEATIRGQAHSGVSFEWMAIVIAGMAAVSRLCRWRSMLGICGISGIALCTFSVLYLCLFEVTFWALVDENAQYTQIIKFSHHYLPENLGLAPSFQASLATDSLVDRLIAATYFMGLGWWISLLGSFLLVIGSCVNAGRRVVQCMALVTLVVFGGQGMLVCRGVAAQYFQDTGDHFLARGLYADAIHQYQKALRYDPQLMWSEVRHRHFGEAYYHLGAPSHPQARLYVGDRYAEELNPESAVAEYLLAAQDASGVLAEILRNRIAWTYVQMGIAQYRREQSGGAVAWWEKALGTDVNQLQAAYFLSRAYFDQGRYERSISIGQFLTDRTQNPLLKADIKSNLGDSYWKLGDLSRARQAYEASMNLDTYANFRIWKSLGGT